jgi:hypothetical protein
LNFVLGEVETFRRLEMLEAQLDIASALACAALIAASVLTAAKAWRLCHDGSEVGCGGFRRRYYL